MGTMVPEVSVMLGKVNLAKVLGCNIDNVCVSLSMENESSAVVELQSVYEKKNHKIISALSKEIALGKKLEISMGYTGETKKVFAGYLESVELEHDAQKDYSLRLYGYDVIRLLKENRQYRIFKEQSCSKVFSDLWKEYNWLCEKQVEDTTSLDEIRCWIQESSDFEFIRQELIACQTEEREFYVSLGKAYYTKPNPAETAVMVWNCITGCLGFHAETHYVNQSIQVQGYSAAYQPFTGQSHACGEQTDTAASKGIVVCQMTEADTKKGADALAERYAAYAKSRAKKIKVILTGCPELVTGKYLELKELDGLWNGRYRIREAIHCLDQRGYQTELMLEGEG